MASCLAELHLWSCRRSLNVTDADIGTYQYYDKGDTVTLTESEHFSRKQKFAEARGYTCTLVNRRPERLRDSLKELEELLESFTCVSFRWRNKHTCQLLLSCGALVTLWLSGAQLECITVDKALVGRLPADTISDAVICDSFLLLTFVEKNKVCLVQLNRKCSPDSSQRGEKLSPSELRLSCVDLPGPAGRRLHRHLHLNLLQDMSVCWWSGVSEESLPWCPIGSEGERANLVLLSCNASGLRVLSSVRTEAQLLDCRFSLRQHYQLLTVELSPEDGPVLSCGYECARGRAQRLSISRVSTPAPPLACARHPGEALLLLGLRDSTLLLYDSIRGESVTAHAAATPTLLAWHPAGALLLVAGGQGELQCFDAGLSPVGLYLLSEDTPPASPSLRLAHHLHCPGGLTGLQWATPTPAVDISQVCDLLLLSYHGGPIGALLFKLGARVGAQPGPLEIVQERLRCGQVEEGVSLLKVQDWNSRGADCYRMLSAITSHLLRLDLNEEREAQLEATLGTFYSSARPLSDTVVLEYRDSVCSYARRFFHHLLRHQRLEKAFLLAVDIGSRDLFMDLHYVARDLGELVLAQVAEKKAEEIEAGLACGAEESVQRERGSRTDKHGTGRGASQLRHASSQLLHGPAARTSRLEENKPSGDSFWSWAKEELGLFDSEEEVAGDRRTLRVIKFDLV